MHMDAEVAPVVGKYLPASQSRHTLMELPPIDAENLPAGQLIHQLDPASEYFPLSHKTHSFEFSVSKGKYDPAAQSMHTMSEIAPSQYEYFPTGQRKQSPGPVVSLYVPALHCTHGPPDGP
jgi:hypothetical protein